jgi:putative DNA primase/helicase
MVFNEKHIKKNYYGRLLYEIVVREDQGATQENESLPAWGDLPASSKSRWITKAKRLMQLLQSTPQTTAKESPVHSYLRGLKWDGTPRIFRVLTEILRARDTEFSQLFLSKWFVAAVARALVPGRSCSTSLVLSGAQGSRKTSFFTTLGGEWFTQIDLRDLNNDESSSFANGWIVELSDIAQFATGKRAKEIKQFLHASSDRYRRSYNRTLVEVPRQCVFVGTVNQTVPRDRSFIDRNAPIDKRRFWTIDVGVVDVEKLAEWRDQLWAEAVVKFDAGERWWLESATETD